MSLVFSRLQLVILICIFSIAIFSGLYHLEDSPRVWFDEGILIHVARNIADHGIYNFTLSPGHYGEMAYISTSYTVLLPIALMLKVFGASLFVARLGMVVFIIALLLATLVYVYRLMGPWPSIAAVALLGTLSPLYGHGKNVLGEIPGLFYLVVATIFFLALERSTEVRSWMVVTTGIFYGLAVATKPIFILLIPGLLVGIFVLHRKATLTRKHGAIFLASFAAPLLLWFLTQFSAGTNFLGVFDHYKDPYNSVSVWSFIIPNLLLFVSDLSPAHFFVVSLLVCGGLWWGRRHVTWSELVLLMFAGLVFLSFLRTPGWYRYFFPAHVVVLLLLPVTLARLSTVSWFKYISILVIVGLFVGQALYLSQSLDRFYSEDWRAIKIFIEENRDKNILFYNVSEGPFFARSNNYSQILRIRKGLAYGESVLENVDSFDYIIARVDSETLNVLILATPSFKEPERFGEYIIFSKRAETESASLPQIP